MATTAPQLLAINCDGPVIVRQIGQRNQGIVWTVQPENFPSLIEFVNSDGVHNWTIEAA